MKFKFLLALLMFMVNITMAKASTVPHVVVSIKPMHAWVSAVMGQLGQPYLLLKNSDSVHSYQLKPSDAQQLSKADLIFITDKNMETYLSKPLANLALKSKIVELSRARGVVLLPARVGGLFEADDDGDEKLPYNFHFWLDPQNAIAATKAIAQYLGNIDKAHAAIYNQNANLYIDRLKQLIYQTETKLKQHKDIKFIVFHDAYYYYEKRFGVTALGAITMDPEHPAGARRIKAIRHKIQQLKTACIYTEPQFSPAIVKTIIEGTSAKQGVLDPIGANIQAGADSYFKLINQITTSLLHCV